MFLFVSMDVELSGAFTISAASLCSPLHEGLCEEEEGCGKGLCFGLVSNHQDTRLTQICAWLLFSTSRFLLFLEFFCFLCALCVVLESN